MDSAPRVASRIAFALGDVEAGRGFADAAREERVVRGEAALTRADQAWSRGDAEGVRAALFAAQRELPADPRVSELAARVALRSGDPDALRAALDRLRRFAPTLEAGIAAENRFRNEQGLPLLPERALGSL